MEMIVCDTKTNYRPGENRDLVGVSHNHQVIPVARAMAESRRGIVILLIYQAPKPAMYSPAKGLALEKAGIAHGQT
jgi:hypothetical protein